MKYVIMMMTALALWSFTAIKPSKTKALKVVSVDSTDTLCDVYIPNTFTPDGNEHNNVLKVFTACEFDAFEFRVYNKSGDVLFISHNPAMAWDGSYKGRIMQGGTYVYTAEYTLRGGEPVTTVGHINLLK